MGKSYNYAFPLLLSLLFLISSCASQTDILMVDKSVKKLEDRSSEQALKLEQLQKEFTEYKTQSTKNQTDFTTRLDQLQAEFQTLNGKFDENKFFILKALKESPAAPGNIKERLENLEKTVNELTLKVSALEKELQVDSTEKPEKNGEKESLSKSPKKGDTAKEGFLEAYDAYKNKKYDEAISKFKSLLKKNPKPPYNVDAQFYLAESYFEQKKYEDAILEYDVVISKYSKSSKAPSALYKQGLSFLNINDKKDAKILFKKVVDTYPKSKEATLAKKKLKEIK